MGKKIFVPELDRFVSLDQDGVAVLGKKEQSYLAMRDAIRDIKSDPHLSGHIIRSDRTTNT